jgi:hypothetical protein
MNSNNVMSASDVEASGSGSNAASSTPAIGKLAAAVGGAVSPQSTTIAGGASNAKVGISFLTRSSDQELITISGTIGELMAGNAAYPAPFPTLVVVTAARTAYVSAVSGLSRGKQAIALRNQTRGALVQALRDLALYVQHASQGNRVMIIGSGFPVQNRRARGSVGLLAPPTHVRIRRTNNSTQLVALCDAVAAARSYQWRCATTLAPTVWTQPDPITKSRFVIEDAVPGTTYIVQVRVFGTAGASDWSDAVMLMAA